MSRYRLAIGSAIVAGIMTGIGFPVGAMGADEASARGHVEAAKEHAAKGEHLAAIDECYFAILERPDFFEAHYQRGLAYLARHDYHKAIRTFDRALEIDPQSALAISHRGFAEAGLRRFDACIADQEKALELDASLALAYARRGAARAAMGDTAKARQDIDKAVALDPTLGPALCERARLKAATGDLRGAAADADAAIRAHPRLARGHFERGMIWMRQGNGVAARASFDEAIRLDPRDAEPFVARGQLRLAAKQYGPARDDFTTAISRDSKLAVAYAGRAEAHKRLRDMAAAKADLEMAKTLQPADPKTRRRAVTKSALPPRFELLSAPVDPARRAAAVAAAKKIDALVTAGSSRHGMTPMPPTDDSQFVRRIYLDIAGRIPTYKEVTAFLHSREPDKRRKLIDQLLGSDDYAFHTFNYWADIFRYRDSLGRDVRGEPWRQWIKQSLAENKPWDDMVREMLCAEGLPWESPASGYLQRDPGMPLDVVNNTARIFLGTRIGCAQCHNHPFDTWTQKQFYEAAAFLFGTETMLETDRSQRLLDGFATLELEEEERRQWRYAFERQVTANMMVVHDTQKQLTLPASYAYDDAPAGAAVEPRPLFGTDATPRAGETPREAFARWLTATDNPRFALTIANRLWKRVFGVGQIEPEDDITAATVAANPELMSFLETQMRTLDFDMKEFLRMLYFTEAYQRQAWNAEVAGGAAAHVPGPILRRMTAEQAWDSILTLAVAPVEYREPPARLYAEAVAVELDSASPADVIAAAEKVAAFDRLRDELQEPFTYQGALLARASELPSPLPPNHFLRMFGQSDRELIQASSTWGSVPQVLFMFNGQISHMLLEEHSTIHETILRTKTVPDGVEAVFLTILSRPPSHEEMAAAIKEVKVDGPAGYGNVVWSLINTREFLFLQ